MSDQDWLIVIVLFVAVGGVAYLMGSRRRQEGEPQRPASDDARARPDSDLPERISLTDNVGGAAADAKASASDLARVEYEEDDDIDPTRVGARAGVAQAKRNVYQPPIQRIVYDEDAGTDEPTQAKSLFLVSSMAQTDKGLRRKRNEDSLLVFDSASLFVVADGMGGYRGGELASQLAVKTMADAFQQGSFEGPPHENVPREATELARAIQMANAAIFETAQRKPELEGMGTTVCAARFSPTKNRLYIGHVGDSRCYRLRADSFVQMTADHTMADHGVKGPESAHLSRAVGIWPTVPIDVLMAVPSEGDVYLLCSDGLTKMLSDDVIANVLRHEDDPKTAVERLIFFANARGGKDNITVILVRVAPPNWKPRPSMTEEELSSLVEGGAGAAPAASKTSTQGRS